MRFFRGVLVALAAGVMLCLAAGYLGWLHPAGDSFAVFRAQGAMALALVAGLGFLAQARRMAAVLLVVAALAGGPVLLAYQIEGEAGALVLYQKNMLFRNSDLAGLEADIRAMAPEVLTLQEVSKANLALLASVSDLLPHQMFCPFAAVGGTAVATRLTPVPGSEICAKGLAAMQVEGPQGRLWLVSIHLHWPWPYRQAAQLETLVPLIAGLDGPMVIAGDFNMVRWSTALGGVRTAGRVRNAGPARGTYPQFGPLLVLPIDHVLAPGGGSIELRPLLGSDHRGLVGRLGLSP
ncbi:endonuclease/exonuclease/phosphatase family protein [Tabrizicola sp.]|uniref:endonuclease/exonuclease/phosphatase family protein n=1 Tax=Tabrizicola sp. TaxID=2005166 RepID=UPI00286B691F|nr:endonuclease/exonuclease/phosphatase family protein [Tabrizicola sp.]